MRNKLIALLSIAVNVTDVQKSLLIDYTVSEDVLTRRLAAIYFLADLNMLNSFDYSYVKASLIRQHSPNTCVRVALDPFIQYTQLMDNLSNIIDVPAECLSANLSSANWHVLYNYNRQPLGRVDSISESFPAAYLVETMSCITLTV